MGEKNIVACIRCQLYRRKGRHAGDEAVNHRRHLFFSACQKHADEACEIQPAHLGDFVNHIAVSGAGHGFFTTATFFASCALVMPAP